MLTRRIRTHARFPATSSQSRNSLQALPPQLIFPDLNLGITRRKQLDSWLTPSCKPSSSPPTAAHAPLAIWGGEGPQGLGVELVQELLEGFLSRLTGHRHGLKIDRRLLLSGFVSRHDKSPTSTSSAEVPCASRQPNNRFGRWASSCPTTYACQLVIARAFLD
jgi:hypothetical protein